MAVIGTFDGTNWVPDSAFSAELNNDPAAMGYKSNGVFKSAHDISVLLTQPGALIANPVAQTSLPKPFTYVDVFDILSAASLANIRSLSLLPRILDDINSLNRAAVVSWANLLIAGTNPSIIQTEHDAIVALMGETILDPSYQAQIPDVSRLEKVFSVGAVPLALITAVTGVK